LAIAGVEHGAIDLFRDEANRARGGVADDDGVGAQALSVMAVSIRVSPFLTLDWPTDIFTTSAPRRLPAISKLKSVRVEFS